MSRDHALQVMKTLGFFSLARHATRERLRILCFHGLAYEDEHLRHPKLFLTEEGFQRRMDLLERLGATVLPLQEALLRLRAGTLPALSVVLTFDDGWRGVFDLAAPVLRAKGFPSTVYVTTSEIEANAPAANIVIESLFMSARPGMVDLSSFDRSLTGSFDLGDPLQRQEAADKLISTLFRNYSPGERGEWVTRCGQWLGCPGLAERYNALYQMVSLEQLADVKADKDSLIDVQLHSHTHRLNLESRQALEENIVRNRAILTPVARSELSQFCYPAGVYHPRIFPWLDALGVESATTCNAGLNAPDADRFALSRYLDGEHLSLLNFEAEVCGALDLMRRARAALKGEHGDATTAH